MKKTIKNIIAKYLQGTISQEESKFLESWISDKKNESLFREAIKQYYRARPFDAKKAFDQFEENIRMHNPAGRKREREIIPQLLKYAAILTGTLLTIYGAYHFSSGDSVSKQTTPQVTLESEDGTLRTLDESDVKKIRTGKSTTVIQQNGDQLSYAKAESDGSKTTLVYNRLKVPYGKRFEVELADGTLVYLNAGSSLRYPVQFMEGGPREVFLTGEGYFKVTKNQQSPFIVRTQYLNTEVFGTEFNVSSYENDESNSVVLVEGSVGIFEGARFEKESGTRLKPNEMATKTIANDLNVVAVDSGLHIAWINGTLLFKNETFETIIHKLERHYNISISNNFKTLNGKRFTGRFNMETIEQVLNTFKRTNDFDYEINENKITINP